MKRLAALMLGVCATTALAIFPNQPSNTPGAGRMGDLSGGNMQTFGSAMAISPTWVLTAGHVGGSRFEQGGQIYTVLQSIVHPTSDLRLVRLDRPVQTAVPLKLNYFQTVPTTQTPLNGDLLTLVGYGVTRTYSPNGWVGVSGSEGIQRTAHNSLDLFYPNVTVQVSPTETKTYNVVMYDLDDPSGNNTTNVMGGPAVQPDEGGIALLDSGGGWLIMDRGRLRLIATSSFVTYFAGTGPYSWGGAGAGVFLQSYAPFFNNVTDMGRAILANPTVLMAQTWSGNAQSLFAIDNNRFTTTTNTTAIDSDIQAIVILDGKTTASPATSMNVGVFGRTSSTLCLVEVKAFHWTTSTFHTIGNFFLTDADQQQTVTFNNAGPYVMPDGSVRVRLDFSPIGSDESIFVTNLDRVTIDVQ